MAPENTAPEAHVPKKNRASLGIVYFTVFLDLLGFGLILPFLPYFIAEDLVPADSAGLGVGTILTSYSLAQLFGASLLGRLSDRYGRRPVLLLSLAGAAAGMVGTGLAGSLVTLALARAVAGLFGGSLSTAQAYVADVTQPDERAKFMGLLGASIGLGFTVGPLLGVGLVLGGFSFRDAAFTAAALNGLNLLFAAWKLRESRAGRRQPSARAPFAWLGTFTRPRLAQAILALFSTTFGFVVMETVLAYWKEGPSGTFAFDERRFGLALGLAGVVMIAVQGGLVGRLTSRHGVRNVASAGALVMAASLAVTPWCPSLAWVFVALAGQAAGQGLASPSLLTLISRLSGADEQGSSLGAGQSMAALARAVTPVVAGALYDVQPAAPWLLGAMLAAVAAGLVRGARLEEGPGD